MSSPTEKNLKRAREILVTAELEFEHVGPDSQMRWANHIINILAKALDEAEPQWPEFSEIEKAAIEDMSDRKSSAFISGVRWLRERMTWKK